MGMILGLAACRDKAEAHLQMGAEYQRRCQS
jgi:hypothetical protein